MKYWVAGITGMAVTALTVAAVAYDVAKYWSEAAFEWKE